MTHTETFHHTASGLIYRAFCLMMLLVLTACGSSGGGPKVNDPAITSFSASATSISAGDSVDLTAVFSDGDGSIDQGIGTVTTATPVSVTPSVTTTYTLTVTNTKNVSVSTSVTITVVPDPVITSFSASSSTITAGVSVNITATFSDGSGSIDQSVGTVQSGVPESVTPSTTTTYTLTVTNALGVSTNQSLTITVVPAPLITSFNASATSITAGDSVDLTATFADGNGSISQSVGSVTTDTPVTVSPTTTTSYTLTVTNSAGAMVTNTLTITVVPAPTITSFSAPSSSIILGSSIDLTAVFSSGTASIDQGIGAVTSGLPVTVSPSTTTTYTLAVTNSLGASVNQTLTITVISANTNLTSLSMSYGALDQVFQSSQLDYTATLGFLIPTIQLNIVPEDAGMAVTVNGVALGSDNLSQTLVLSEGLNTQINIAVTATNGINTKTYTLTITRETSSVFAQQAYVKAYNTDSGDNFGWSVALDGDTLAVGAYLEDSAATGINDNANKANDTADASGAVFVFTRSSGVWSQQAYIKAGNADAVDRFGYAVALEGDTLAVGAYLEDGAATTINGSDNNDANAAGAVYVFTRSSGIWSQQAYIKADNAAANDRFGASVALSTNTLAVGATGQSNTGAVYVFTSNAGAWSQQAYLKATNADTDDGFGASLALDGDTLAIGAINEDSAVTGINGDDSDNSADAAGAVYIFTRDIDQWNQQAYIKASNTDIADNFGFSLSLDQDTLAVGAKGEDSVATNINGDETDNTATDSGAVYVFTRSSNTWSQQAYIKASNTGNNDGFGYSVALDGDALVIGAQGEDSAATGINGDELDNSANHGAGAVYVFTRNSNTWSKQAYVKASNSNSGDNFGWSVDIDGDTIASGAIGEASAAITINGDETDNTALNAGAVFVFR